MKLVRILGVSSALCLGACAPQAQETNQWDQVSQQLKQLQENFDRQQRELRERFEKTIQEQQAQINALKQQLEAVKTNAPVAAPSPSAAAPAPANASAPATVPGPAVPEPTAASAPAATATAGWNPANPIRLQSGGSYLDVGLVGDFVFGSSTADDIEGGTQLGGHDPNQRGFTVQGVEANFQGAVDPYFRGNANLAYLLDSHGDSSVELEEGWLETISLPLNLQVRAGQMLTEFGRLNTQHPHAWEFVDTSLVNGRFLGGDGLRNPGARVSWLTPTPFYSELFLSVQNSQGETAYSFRNDNGDEPLFGRPVTQGHVDSLGDLLFTPRYAVSFDLSDTQTLLGGVSAAFGPNGSGNDTTTQIYGTDLYWKWKPANAHAGFPFVSWQTEAMLRRYEAGATLDGGYTTGLPGISLPQETLTDWGLYTEIAYGFRRGWVAAVRGDYVTPNGDSAYEAILGPDRQRAERWRISPNLTWYPTEFSKLRLQYNFDERKYIGPDHSVWFQFEFLIGAHAAHKF